MVFVCARVNAAPADFTFELKSGRMLLIIILFLASQPSPRFCSADYERTFAEQDFCLDLGIILLKTRATAGGVDG